MNALYADLPHIEEVRPRTSADDALFAEMAEVLKRHNALDRFGVCLLHTHFAIDDGEVLVEETDENGRVQTIRPKPIGAHPDVIETSWRLGPNGEAIQNCVCVGTDGWSHRHHSHGG
jgi:hypothetical protein